MDDKLAEDIEAFFSVMRRYRLAVTPWVTSGMARRGISLSQYTVLAVLKENGESTMGRLTARLGTTMGATTSLVDRLRHAGLIERKRSTEDRRIVTAKLTPEGRRMLDDLRADGKELVSDAFARIPADDRRTFIDVHKKLAEFLREKWKQRTESVGDEP